MIKNTVTPGVHAGDEENDKEQSPLGYIQGMKRMIKNTVTLGVHAGDEEND